MIIRRTFAVQRSCALEQFATTLHPRAVRLLLSNVQDVSPAWAPRLPITAGKKPFPPGPGEQALASSPHTPPNRSALSLLPPHKLRSAGSSPIPSASPPGVHLND